MIFDVTESDDDLSSLSGDEISDDEAGFSDDEDFESDGDSGSGDDDDANDPREDVRWDVGQVIRVRFTNGNSTIHKKVKKYAKIWMQYANITFKFVSSDPSDVRVSFYKGKGCHSKVGKYALKVLTPKPTMNLGFPSHAPEEKIRRTVLHEFGHVLGCSHEHSSPLAEIPWNEKAVYAHFEKTDGWNRDKIFHNVLKVKHSNSVASEFDPESIMIYEIPREITKGGYYIPWNTNLSKIDKHFIGVQYPKPLRCKRCRHKIDDSSDVHFRKPLSFISLLPPFPGKGHSQSSRG